MELPDFARVTLSERYIRVGDERNENVSDIAGGGFGKVYIAFDAVLQHNVMVKNQPTTTPECSRELTMYEFFKAFPHDNIIRMLNSFVASDGGSQGKPHLHLVFELYPTSLWQMYSNPSVRTGALPLDQIKGYVKGTAAGLMHLHLQSS